MNCDASKKLKKFIKEENESNPRLQSLRIPRDLSLGGAKPTKKRFLPNLNIVRNKDNAKNFLKKFEPTIEKGKRDNKNNLKTRHNNNRLVQSSGIFSDGSAVQLGRAHQWTDSRSDKENDGKSAISAMTMPTIKKDSWEVDKKEEDIVLDEILKCDDDDEDEKLPFQPTSWHNKYFRELKTEIKDVKVEPETEDDQTMNFNLAKIKLESDDATANEYMNSDIYNDHNPALMLWKLPDSFAGKGLSDDPNCKKLFDYCLDDMLEGQIGKLVIRKSGKIEVQIGSIKYNLESSGLESYKEEIVALDDKNVCGPSAAVLGHIQNRYLLNPDWEMLLH